MGGEDNCITGIYSSVGGGNSNTVDSGSYTVIAGGCNNRTCANCFAFIFGKNNCLSHNDAAIIGSDLDSVAAETLHAKCLYLSAGALPTSDPSVAGIVWRDGTDLKISVG